QVFGTDYPTPDGTCIRDYIHVTDLADAHLLALAQLQERSVTWNLGNGHGHSVLEVIRAVERVSGRHVPYTCVDRRPGDPPVLVAASTEAQRAGWKPRFAALDEIVRTALVWRKAHPHGYGD
ncbi:MAG: NAD-dependent epimerase/dehydratase family protein, partial [Acetobacteraceae bacterium]|nr:NAD-dependent epimerase/dehydratase family protein [Acetobacteraceae bacterium]